MYIGIGLGLRNNVRPPAPPALEFTGNPVLSYDPPGNPMPGSNWTVGSYGTWTGTPDTLLTELVRVSDSAVLWSGAPEGAFYLIQESDVGELFILRVTIEGELGSDTAESAAIEVMPSLPTVINPPSIQSTSPGNDYELYQGASMFTPYEGEVNGTVDSVSYQWYRNGSPVPGATTSSINTGDYSFAEGDTFYLEKTWHNASGTVSAQSNTTITLIATP